MRDQIQKIKTELEEALKLVLTGEDLQKLKVQFLGRKGGSITKLFEDFKALGLEEKRQFGTELNALKKTAEDAVLLFEKKFIGELGNIDYTVPAIKVPRGHLHPITIIQKEIEDIFTSLGFNIEVGPEIESDYYNFEALNIPEDHPARDMQDTFYLDLEPPKGEKGKHLLLRTHISNMQVRYMQKHKPPFSVVLPGRVFRNESLDASHEHTYQYMEGFVVGENVSFSSMSWTLDYVMKQLFGQDVEIKLRPSYFPFVEPGAEMAISCLVCKGSGCSVCKQTGWVEILGCGMIHQEVFKHAGYKPNQYQGFAFGFGLSRMAMMKYSIPDIRLFAENDLRFLDQF